MKAKKKRSIIIRLLVIGVAVYMLITLVSLWRELGQSEANLKSLNQKKESVLADIEQYNALLSDDSQKSIVEKAARERFGFAYPGEEIYKEIK